MPSRPAPMRTRPGQSRPTRAISSRWRARGGWTKYRASATAIAAKISELVQTGRLEFYEKLRAEFPPTLFDLFELQGVGAKKIKALYEQLGVTGIPDLEAACKSGRVAALAGFGEKTAAKMLAAIEARGRYADTYRLGDGRAAGGASARAPARHAGYQPGVHRGKLPAAQGDACTISISSSPRAIRPE